MAVCAGARFGAGVPLAAVITLALFLGMRGLIATDEIHIPPTPPTPDLQIAHKLVDTEPTRNVRPTPPADVKTPPPPPRRSVPPSQHPGDDQLAALGRLPTIDPSAIDTAPVDVAARTQTLRPLVRIEPVYPARAAERGLEGDCLMTFDVNPDGTVAASSIVAECTSSAFARAATRAVQGWKYQPEIRDGQGVIRYGVQTELSFRFSE